MRDNSLAMRVKSILSLIAFVAAFALSVALVALTTENSSSQYQIAVFQADGATQRNITRFLAQDISNGVQRERRVYRYEDGASMTSPFLARRAEAVSDYAETSGAMDYNNLPQDFQLAWLKHMRAWHNYSDFLQKAKTQNLSYSEINRLENQYNRDINLTWFETLRVAGKYGAEIPDGAY